MAKLDLVKKEVEKVIKVKETVDENHLILTDDEIKSLVSVLYRVDGDWSNEIMVNIRNIRFCISHEDKFNYMGSSEGLFKQRALDVKPGAKLSDLEWNKK